MLLINDPKHLNVNWPLTSLPLTLKKQGDHNHFPFSGHLNTSYEKRKKIKLKIHS